MQRKANSSRRNNGWRQAKQQGVKQKYSCWHYDILRDTPKQSKWMPRMYGQKDGPGQAAGWKHTNTTTLGQETSRDSSAFVMTDDSVTCDYCTYTFEFVMSPSTLLLQCGVGGCWNDCSVDHTSMNLHKKVGFDFATSFVLTLSQ